MLKIDPQCRLIFFRKNAQSTSATPEITMRVELSESICGSSLLRRATDRWPGVRMSWRTKAFRVSRWWSRDVRARICRGHYRTRLRISDCVWAVHACRGLSRERRDGSRLPHVLRGDGAHAGGKVFPNHEWRRTRPDQLLGFLFHYLLRPGALEHRCATAQDRSSAAST